MFNFPEQIFWPYYFTVSKGTQSEIEILSPLSIFVPLMFGHFSCLECTCLLMIGRVGRWPIAMAMLAFADGDGDADVCDHLQERYKLQDFFVKNAMNCKFFTVFF